MSHLTSALVLFGSSLLSVMLLGFQSQLNRLGHKMPAFFISACIGVMQIVSYKLVPGAETLELVMFVLGGSCGIVVIIHVHGMYIRYRNIDDTRGIARKNGD
jgi:predicted membrane channel-forming protein YqfA (hemolysin III family)